MTCCRDERQLPPRKLASEQVDRHLVEDFLQWLEVCRCRATSTRSNRLAAIHVFSPIYSMKRRQEILSKEGLSIIFYFPLPAPPFRFVTAMTLHLSMGFFLLSSGIIIAARAFGVGGYVNEPGPA